MRLKKFLQRYKVDIALIFLVALISITLASKGAILTVVGTSMEPTYSNGAKVVIKKDNVVETDSLIVFNAHESWTEKEKPFFKRVVGKPGDTVIIRDNKVAINGHVKFESSCLNGKALAVSLRDGEYFVMGDNRKASNDSLSQFCSGNDSYLVTDDNVILIGHEIMKFGGN